MQKIIRDWNNGLHNGIPKCCIFWFILRKLSWGQIPMRNPTAYGIWNKYTRTYPNGYDYIHCPYHAILNESVYVHDCKERGCET